MQRALHRPFTAFQHATLPGSLLCSKSFLSSSVRSTQVRSLLHTYLNLAAGKHEIAELWILLQKIVADVCAHGRMDLEAIFSTVFKSRPCDMRCNAFPLQTFGRGGMTHNHDLLTILVVHVILQKCIKLFLPSLSPPILTVIFLVQPFR